MRSVKPAECTLLGWGRPLIWIAKNASVFTQTGEISKQSPGVGNEGQ